MFESDVQFADAAVGGADWCESGGQSPSRSPSWSSEESCRENGLPDVLHGVTSQRIRVRRPRAKASEAAQALYNPEYQDPNGSSVLTNVSFVEREDERASCFQSEPSVRQARARGIVDAPWTDDDIRMIAKLCQLLIEWECRRRDGPTA
jgi:hypothetical protein